MMIAPHFPMWLLQAARMQDTIVAKTMPVGHSVFDYTSGTLQIIVLVLAIVVLGAMAYVLIAVKRAVDFGKHAVEKFQVDTGPIIAKASSIADDAREVVAMLKTDAERVTHATESLSTQLLDVAGTVTRRIDDINAVVDVVQDELEETVLSTTAAFRGVRLGGRAMAKVMTSSNGTKRKRPARDEQIEVERPRLRDRHSRRQRDAGD